MTTLIPRERLSEGTAVEVFNGFSFGWTQGFVVHDVLESGHGRLYQLRRFDVAEPLDVLFEGRRVRADLRLPGRA